MTNKEIKELAKYIKEEGKKIFLTKEKSKKFLIDMKVLTKSGNLTARYK